MRSAFRFVLIMGIVNLFADMTYEGARSATGPFLAHLGASGLIVGLVAGFGEFIGFGLRVVFGAAADRTRKYWPFAIVGYAVNMLSVPALALARVWPVAAIFIVGERLGRSIRKPATGAMLSHAGSQLGQGWVFGFNEAMDQTGAAIGPLVVALVLWLHGSFNNAFALLGIPAVAALVVLGVARFTNPTPQKLEVHSPTAVGGGFDRAFWIYVAAGAFVAAGFADFALVSYHFSKAHIFSNSMIPILYAVAMLIPAVAAPFAGRLFDRFGIIVVLVAFGVSALFAPFSFLGSPALAIAGIALWGFGLAAQDTLLPSIVAKLTPPARRATALGTFDTIYGVAWFAGTAVMGALYDRTLVGLVIVSVALQVVALPLFLIAARYQRSRSV
jgi:predicted MFS family arabinose efflux permease